MKNLFEQIETIGGEDNTAKIPMLRAVANSSMAKAIGAIRQSARDRQYNSNNPETTSLDERNQVDEQHTDRQAQGEFPPRPDYMLVASKLHAVYDWARTELETLTTSRWNQPMEIEDMLNYMINNSNHLDDVLAKALADAAKVSVEQIKYFDEVQQMREREQMIELRPEILATFNSFKDNGYEGALTELDIIDQHQLGIKAYDSLVKAKDNTLNRALRTRRISELGDIPILEDAIEQMAKWVSSFETKHRSELDEAYENGRNIRTTDDIWVEKQAQARRVEQEIVRAKKQAEIDKAKLLAEVETA